MPVIHVLPREVAELIAAGEVIERPASIVKELVENAIDAGSTSISVEIQGGGIRYIRVTDNGCGIAPEDAPKAFLRHATSKVQLADDLDHIGTLGFRGEALASIAAVAHVEMMTRPAELELGALVRISGSEPAQVSDCGCPAGTTIVIRDIFYNVPARLKFLKRDVTEGNAVASIVDKIALSHPEISFQFIRDGKSLYRTPGDGELMGAVYTVLGREFAKSLIPVDYELGGIRVEGLTCRPMGSRAKRNMQHFFINGRYTQSKTCTAALERGYDGALMVGKFPACVLQLTMPCDQVDVNVHPAKIEVRFVNEKSVFDAVYFAVKSGIAAAEALSGKPEFEGKPASRAGLLSPFGTGKTASEPVSADPDVPRDVVEEAPAEEAASPCAPEPSPQRKAPRPEEPPAEQEPPVPGARVQVREEWLPPRRSQVRLDVEPDPLDFLDMDVPARVAAPCVYHLTEEPDSPPEEQRKPSASAGQETLLPGQQAAPSVQVFGEVFSTYILARIGEELVIIDKHAAHERILYNQLQENHQKLSPQMLLSSVQVPLSRQEHQAVLEHLSLFADLGFEAEDFGGSTILLRSMPALMGDEPPAALFADAVAALTEAGRKSVSALEEILHRMACRSAVKGGDQNRPEELQALVETISRDEQVRYCPHGRPVMLRYSKKELEKLFGRIQ
ncbi:MAG: DNA mismatch repair endonuclease MutL [Oscillospiraceae bacterium]|nr:DNA mismatch repair endonuclease MutL [Oscillospiraceae bacterium]